MRKIKLIQNNHYHIYNRGVNRGKIFFQTENWNFFLRRLRHYFLPELVDILAYCLMPTHYHLLVCLKTDDFAHKVMHPFTVSYTKAINKQQERVGPLFQGPFQAKYVDNSAYLAHLTRYIHLNPVDAEHVSHPAEWVYSSYQDYVGLRGGTLPQKDFVLQSFEDQGDYQHYVEGETRQDLRAISHLLFD